MTDIMNRFRPTDFHETQEELKTWSDLKGEIQGLADFLTPSEQEEIESLTKQGKLPDNVDIKAVNRYIGYCDTELLPGINKNRIDAGLPRLSGRVLENAIMGDRWKRDRAGKGGVWYNNTADRVFINAALPKSGQWGHMRDEFLRGRADTAAAKLKEVLMGGGTVPDVKLVSEHFTYRDENNIPYGFAYSVRLEQQTVVTGALLEQVISDHMDTLSEYVYRELPESITKGVPYAEASEEQRAFYRFIVKKSLEGLGITASLL